MHQNRILSRSIPLALMLSCFGHTYRYHVLQYFVSFFSLTRLLFYWRDILSRFGGHTGRGFRRNRQLLSCKSIATACGFSGIPIIPSVKNAGALVEEYAELFKTSINIQNAEFSCLPLSMFPTRSNSNSMLRGLQGIGMPSFVDLSATVLLLLNFILS